MAQDVAKIAKRLESLQSLRAIHEQVWQDCFDYTYPIRGSGLQQSQYTAQQAQSKKAQILDSTGTDSARILASAIMSGLTPANSRWFQLDVGQETEDERRWLDDAATVLWENIHSSNFDAAGFEACLDVVCAGWFALYIEEDAERGGLSFQQWPISGIFCASSKAGGKIDSVYRPFELSAEQAVVEFGEDNVSPKTAELAKTKPDEKLQFIHAIYPRTPHAVGAKLAKNLPFASCKIELSAKKIVNESGYHEFPLTVPRWMLIPNSAYGVGPVADALPDMKMLNELCRMELNAADMAISGMWIAEDDGVLNPRTVKVGAKKIIIANSVDSMKSLTPGSNFDVSFTIKKELQAAIRKTLMADQLQPQDGPAMTATEVHVRVNLIRQLLGPVYGRLQAEYLQPLIERCFSLAYRAGVFTPPPESLAGREFSIKYISPLARAQKMEEVTAIERLYAGAGQVSAARGNTDVMDNINDDEAIRLTSEALGVPSKVIRDSKTVEKLRADRAEAQQAMQQQAMMQPVIEEGGKALAQKMVAQA